MTRNLCLGGSSPSRALFDWLPPLLGIGMSPPGRSSFSLLSRMFPCPLVLNHKPFTTYALLLHSGPWMKTTPRVIQMFPCHAIQTIVINKNKFLIILSVVYFNIIYSVLVQLLTLFIWR